VDRPTSLTFVSPTGGQARYDFHDGNPALRAMTPAGMPALPDAVTTLFPGGISLMAEPCGAPWATRMDQVARLLSQFVAFAEARGEHHVRIATALARAALPDGAVPIWTNRRLAVCLSSPDLISGVNSSMATRPGAFAQPETDHHQTRGLSL